MEYLKNIRVDQIKKNIFLLLFIFKLLRIIYELQKINITLQQER